MSQLLDLPNELLLDIINVIRVDDIEAFASCTQRIRALSHDVLQKHREMKMKYSTIRCTSMPVSHRVMDVRLQVHPVIWLYEIILDGTVASYPTSLIIHDPSDSRTDPRYDANPPMKYPGSDARKRDVEDKIRSILEHCPYIQPRDMHLWMRRPPWLYFDTALGLLLSLLPNLQTIFIGGPRPLRTDGTQYMLAHIARENQKYNHNTNPLSRLVSIDRFSEEGVRWGCKELDFYLTFINFPSIRRIGGYSVHDRKEGTASAMAHNPPSKAKSRNDSTITEIKFEHSNISGESFEKLFGRINALHSFEYGHFPVPIDELGKFECCSIVASLQANASHSLVHLDLTVTTRLLDDKWKMIYPYGQIFVGSLREFQVLKTIRANDTMFIERVASPALLDKEFCKINRLVDLLPKSIEALQLVGIKTNPNVHSSGIFDGLVELKAQNLPNLKAINLDYFDPVAPDLKAAFSHEVGVDFTFIPKGMMEK